MTQNGQRRVIYTSILSLALAALTSACTPEPAIVRQLRRDLSIISRPPVELRRHIIDGARIDRVAGHSPAGVAVVKAKPGFPPPSTEWFTRTVDELERGGTRTTAYRVLEEFTYAGWQAYRVEVGGWCCSIYEKATGRLMAQSKEDVVTRPLLRSLLDTIHWPIWVGKTWSGTVVYGTTASAFTTSVDAYEDVNVPAGTFKAFRIRMRWEDRLDILYWYAPEIQLFVKSGDETELIEFRRPK